MADRPHRQRSLVDQQIQAAQERGEFDNLAAVVAAAHSRTLTRLDQAARPDETMAYAAGPLLKRGRKHLRIAEEKACESRKSRPLAGVG